MCTTCFVVPFLDMNSFKKWVFVISMTLVFHNSGIVAQGLFKKGVIPQKKISIPFLEKPSKKGQNLSKYISKWGKPTTKWPTKVNQNECKSFLFCGEGVILACQGKVEEFVKLKSKQCKSKQKIVRNGLRKKFSEYYAALPFEDQIKIVKRDLQIGDPIQFGIIAFPDLIEEDETFFIASDDDKYFYTLYYQNQKITSIEKLKDKKEIKRRKAIAKAKRKEERKMRQEKRGGSSIVGSLFKASLHVGASAAANEIAKEYSKEQSTKGKSQVKVKQRKTNYSQQFEKSFTKQKRSDSVKFGKSCSSSKSCGRYGRCSNELGESSAFCTMICDKDSECPSSYSCLYPDDGGHFKICK